jgi:DNA (cytosine-5)-methyltransferase 1
MKHGSLFSGIGGFDLAAEWMGWENVFHCEINEFCNKILKHYWPNAKSYTDIKSTNFNIWKGTIDIITGGFPCQPFSGAGNRKGKEDDRYLWEEMLRTIREVQPRWVVCENVSGLISLSKGMVFHEIQTSLEAEGYEIFPVLNIPACSKDLPHKRERVWIIAYSNKVSIVPTITKDRSVKVDGFNKEKWSKGRSEFKLVAGTGYSQVDFYNGVDFEPTIIRVDDGIPSQLDELEAFGNSIVPQIAYDIFKTIEQFENLPSPPPC